MPPNPQIIKQFIFLLFLLDGYKIEAMKLETIGIDPLS